MLHARFTFLLPLLPPSFILGALIVFEDYDASSTLILGDAASSLVTLRFSTLLIDP